MGLCKNHNTGQSDQIKEVFPKTMLRKWLSVCRFWYISVNNFLISHTTPFELEHFGFWFKKMEKQCHPKSDNIQGDTNFENNLSHIYNNLTDNQLQFIDFHHFDFLLNSSNHIFLSIFRLTMKSSSPPIQRILLTRSSRIRNTRYDI